MSFSPKKKKCGVGLCGVKIRCLRLAPDACIRESPAVECLHTVTWVCNTQTKAI